MRVRPPVTTLALALSLAAMAPSPATATSVSLGAPEDADLVDLAVDSVTMPGSSLGEGPLGTAREPSPAGGVAQSGARPSTLPDHGPEVGAGLSTLPGHGPEVGAGPSTLPGLGPGVDAGPSTLPGLGPGVDAGSSTGLRLEVDASGKLVPALPSPGLVAEERACSPDADTCAGPTRAGAWDRPRALARDLGIVALFAGGLLALARAIRRLS